MEVALQIADASPWPTLKVIGAIIKRKRSFLEQYEWKTIPWAQNPDAKPINMKVQDIFCDIPGFMEDADNLRQHPSKTRFQILQHKVNRAIAHLYELQRDWMEENPDACWEVSTGQIPSVWAPNNVPPFFNSILYFKTFSQAVDAMYLDVVFLLLYELCEFAHFEFPKLDKQSFGEDATNESKASNPLLWLGTATSEEYAIELCRMIDYMLSDHNGHRGPLASLFSMRIASRHLSQQPEVFNRLQRIFHGVSTRKGFAIGEQLIGMDVSVCQV